MSSNTTDTSDSFPSSSYRVKFIKKNFLHLVKLAKPNFIFHVERMYFFAFQGFVVYSLECQSGDFNHFDGQILEAIEFSNGEWSEGGGFFK